MKLGLALTVVFILLGSSLAYGAAPVDTVDKEVSVTISAAGDTTLGWDYRKGYQNSFEDEFKRQREDYSFFFRNVRDVFMESDLNVANLEGVLTNSHKHADKEFVFRGSPKYVNILRAGNINVVSLANNHIYDYLEQGYRDTKHYLREAGIGYFGYGQTYITTIKGIKIGLLGYMGWTSTKWDKENIRQGIQGLKSQGVDLIVVNFHWGKERFNYPSFVQQTLGRFAIDEGADLVIGCHPHVIQGIELYRGRYIVYSLGNFSFGGNRNPSDKDTFIFQQTFFFRGGRLESIAKNIIPCSISSVKERNNFQPTPLTGKAAERVLKRIQYYSRKF